MDISKALAGARLDKLSRQPMYLQIAGIIGEKIQDMVFSDGTRLPPERELAELFGVSRTTAINAYRYLEKQGLVFAREGSGTYVAEVPAARKDGGRRVPWVQLMTPFPKLPLSTMLREILTPNVSGGSMAGMPDPAFYPVDLLRQIFAGDNKSMDPVDLGHIATEGYDHLRRLVARMLVGRSIETTMENVMITAGSQQALYLIGKAMLEPGDYVVVESPTFIGAHQVFSASGARILGLPVARQFPFSLLEDYLIRYRPKLLYLIPTYHNPTGRLMPENERRELLRLAARHRLVVVEDDPYSELYYDEKPPVSLKGMDAYGGVVYLSTFSKVLFPGLRTGYVVAHPALLNRMAMEKQFIDLHSNNLAQWFLCQFLQSGLLPGHLALVRGEYKKRRNALSKALRRYCGEELFFEAPRGGFFIWCRINRSILSSRLLQQVFGAGVSFVPGEAFYVHPREGERELRLCFVTQAEKALQESARRLARALAQLKRAGKESAVLANQPVKPIV
ncbi:MAG: PLP-dependent aminotransferase family protein [Firmicutes bacterium]|nr:PLP-dependent aminotransferase family protein [Bacillota bacterium]